MGKESYIHHVAEGGIGEKKENTWVCFMTQQWKLIVGNVAPHIRWFMACSVCTY